MKNTGGGGGGGGQWLQSGQLKLAKNIINFVQIGKDFKIYSNLGNFFQSA